MSDEAEPMIDAGVAPMIDATRKFIEANWGAFRSSALTFRKLKTHLVSVLGLNYDDLDVHRTELGSALDDEVEAITQRCDTGRVSHQICLWPRADGSLYVFEKREPRWTDFFVQRWYACVFGVLVLVALAMIRKALSKRRAAKRR